MNERSARVVADLRAGSPGACTCRPRSPISPRARSRRSCRRRPPAGARHAGVRQAIRPPRRRCSRSRQPDSPLREPATWWLLNRMSNGWADYGLRPALKTAGIYDPDAITLQGGGRPAARRRSAGALGGRDRRSSPAMPPRARRPSTRCLMCHSIGGTGAEVGPALDGWGRGKSADVIATAIVQPERRDRARLRRHRDQDEGRHDDPGRADQGRGSADDAQHGRRHPDHSRRPRRHAPPHRRSR